MTTSLHDLLGLPPASAPAPGAAPEPAKPRAMRFSFLFFSEVSQGVDDAAKYAFVRDITLFADREGFEAVYFPERHFHAFGAIFANPAIMVAHLIPQTQRIRFRTAGVSLPLHHPTEVVEWWAMNDVLSGGRVDLGFGSGWARGDFILAPDRYEDRREICSRQIGVVQKLWRGEAVAFPGPGGESIPVTVFPRPVQRELDVWLLVTQNDEGFLHAGRAGYNVFTMLYGNNLEVMGRKIALYRQGRREAGLDPAGGTVTLMLHALLLDDRRRVEEAVEKPFRAYIQSSLQAHLQAAAQERGGTMPDAAEQARILDYAYQRYLRTCAIFGTLDDGRAMVRQAQSAGVDEIALLVDFGVEHGLVREGLAQLAILAKEGG